MAAWARRSLRPTTPSVCPHKPWLAAFPDGPPEHMLKGETLLSVPHKPPHHLTSCTLTDLTPDSLMVAQTTGHAW